MSIERCSAQSKRTLTEFYTELLEVPDSEVDHQIGKAMLVLLEMINEIFPLTPIWGLTSLYHLKLLAQNDAHSPWLISIIGRHEDYHIEYLLPAHKAPWSNAYVKGEAHSVAQAQTYLCIAMKESEGWPNSPELKAYFK